MSKVSQILIALILFSTVGLISFSSQAAVTEVTVDSSTALQTALSNAQADPNDTIINLLAGNYSTTANGGTFMYTSALEKSLTLEGAGIGETVLDGEDSDRILSIQHTGASGEVKISRLTIQNGFNDAVGTAGPGLFVKGDNIDVVLEELEIDDNQNDGDASRAGGFYIETLNGGVALNRLLVTNNHETNAVSSPGGGGFIYAATSVNVTNCIFYKNSTTDEGGAMEIETPTAKVYLTNNTFIQNTASDLGGGVFLDIFDVGAEAYVYNNIFYGNTANGGATAGDDIYIDNIDLTNQPAEIFNNIVVQSCFPSGCDPDSAPDVTAGNNNNQDPLLVDPTAGDFNLGQNSPAIDAGDSSPPGGLPTPDFDGNNRPIGPFPDLGALEALPQLQLVPNNVNFGDVSTGDQVSQEVTLKNDGAGSVTISSLDIDIQGELTFNEMGGAQPCGSIPFSILGGGTCTVTITFNPTVTGTVNATIQFNSDDPNNPTLTLTVSGNGVEVSGGSCSLSREGGFGKSTWFIFAVFFGIFWVIGRRIHFLRK